MQRLRGLRATALVTISLAGAAAVALACSSSDEPAASAVTPDAGGSVDVVADGATGDAAPAPFPATPPTTLTGTGLFASPPIVDGVIQPAADLVRYELATPLFSDYAVKTRAIRFPAGAAATYDAKEVLDFPVGTVVTKTFSMEKDRRDRAAGLRVIETRVLVRTEAGWEAYPYVWNDAQTEATYAPGGRIVPIATIDATGAPVDFSYLVPAKNQCQQCHHLIGAEGGQVLTLIGPKARNLNYVVDGENQLDRWARLGKLTGLPAAADRPRAIAAFDGDSGTLAERARTYLDVNCAHCHRPEGTVGVTSQLFLDIWNQDTFHLGVCKRPGSAGPDVGGNFDIVPGDHAHSVLWYRLHTTESGKMMPQIGRTIAHAEGAALIADFIDALPAQVCQ